MATKTLVRTAVKSACGGARVHLGHLAFIAMALYEHRTQRRSLTKADLKASGLENKVEDLHLFKAMLPHVFKLEGKNKIAVPNGVHEKEQMLVLGQRLKEELWQKLGDEYRQINGTSARKPLWTKDEWRCLAWIAVFYKQHHSAREFHADVHAMATMHIFVTFSFHYAIRHPFVRQYLDNASAIRLFRAFQSSRANMPFRQIVADWNETLSFDRFLLRRLIDLWQLCYCGVHRDEDQKKRRIRELARFTAKNRRIPALQSIHIPWSPDEDKLHRVLHAVRKEAVRRYRAEFAAADTQPILMDESFIQEKRQRAPT